MEKVQIDESSGVITGSASEDVRGKTKMMSTTDSYAAFQTIIKSCDKAFIKELSNLLRSIADSF